MSNNDDNIIESDSETSSTEDLYDSETNTSPYR